MLQMRIEIIRWLEWERNVLCLVVIVLFVFRLVRYLVVCVDDKVLFLFSFKSIYKQQNRFLLWFMYAGFVEYNFYHFPQVL